MLVGAAAQFVIVPPQSWYSPAGAIAWLIPACSSPTSYQQVLKRPIFHNKSCVYVYIHKKFMKMELKDKFFQCRTFVGFQAPALLA